jgi:hypothetical protein
VLFHAIPTTKVGGLICFTHKYLEPCRLTGNAKQLLIPNEVSSYTASRPEEGSLILRWDTYRKVAPKTYNPIPVTGIQQNPPRSHEEGSFILSVAFLMDHCWR